MLSLVSKWTASTFIVSYQQLFSYGIIVQRLPEQGTVNNIIQCIDLFQIAFVKEEGTIIRISVSHYMLNRARLVTSLTTTTV